MTKKKQNLINTADHDPEGSYTQLRSELSPARNLNDLEQRVLSIVIELGFSDFIFIRLQRSWQESSKYGLLCSVPEEYMRVYHEEKMHAHDLMIPYAKTNTQPIFASQIYGYLDKAPFDIELTQKNRVLSQLNKRFGFFDQYFIPLKSFNGHGNVQLSILNKGVNPVEFQADIMITTSVLRLLCKAIDSITSTRFRTSFIGKQDHRVTLRPKQLAVLTMLANNDLTISELANMMCISPITAHQHIAAARKALGVSTNIAAIKKLIGLGLLEFH